MNIIRKRKNSRALPIILAAALCFSNHFTIVINAEHTDQTKQSLENDLSKLQKDKDTLSSELSAATSSLQTTMTEIETTKQNLGAAKARATGQYEMMKKRVKYIYESCSGDFISLLFEADSIADLLNRADFISSISEYDRSMLKKLQQIQIDIEAKEQLLSAQQKSLEEQKATLSDKYTELTSRITDASNDLAAYEKQLAAAKAAEESSKELLEEAKPPAGNHNPPADTNHQDGTSEDSSTQKPNKPVPPANIENVALFAGILECEAGSTNYNGLLAVATVIMNRVESPRYPGTLREVIYQSGQFSPTWTGRLDDVLERGPKSLCYTVAKDALNGKRYAPVINCYSFNYTGSGVSGIDVGGNTFY